MSTTTPQTPTYQWAIESHAGMVRDNNEDSFGPDYDGAQPGPVVIAVADGMGGHVAGEVASATAIEAALEDPADADVTVVDRVRKANDAVIAGVTQDPRLSGMGTTLTLGLFAPDGRLTIGHIGDSRAYLLRASTFMQLTGDDTVVADLLAGGHITEDEARNHPRKHLVTQSIGMRELEVEATETQLEAGDVVLMCSDGLTTMVEDEAIHQIIRTGRTPSEIAFSLIAAANAAGGYDNTTVAVVHVQSGRS